MFARAVVEPSLTAAQAVELLGGDRDPVRVAVTLELVRSRRERRVLLRRLDDGPWAA